MTPLHLATRSDIARLASSGQASYLPADTVPQALQATAARHADRPALSWLRSADPAVPAGSWTHAELLHRVRQTANLLHGLGVDDDHALAFLLPAVPAAWLALLGGEAAGRVCPINVLLDTTHIAELLRAVRARVLVALAPCPELDLSPKVAELRRSCPELRHVLWTDGEAALPDGAAPLPDRDFGRPGAGPGDRFEDRLAPMRGDRYDFDRRLGPDRVAACFHTGGTTGAPKLAQHTHANQLHTSVGAAHFYAATEHDVMLSGFPLFHVAGAFVFGLSTLLAGGHLLLPTRWGLRDAAFVRHYWRFVQRHRVTLLAAVPTVMSALLAVDPGDADRSSVRALYTGGSPLPDELAAAFEQRLGIPVRNILGMTECAGVISIEPFHGPRVAGSCGLALPFTEVVAMATPAHGGAPLQPLPAGSSGILAVRGPHVGPGYTDAARNAGTFEDGWLITGDIGHVREDGRIFVTGRAKDVIIRSSHNIDPGLIEEALLQHPAVLHAAAVGEPDAYAGELPVAFVVLKPGQAIDAATLLAEVAPRIAERPAVPKRLTLLPSMPMTAIGKVYKPALRRLAVQHALHEQLELAGLAARVTLAVDETPQGLQVRCGIRAGAEADRAAVQALMGPFALRWRIDEMQGE